MRLVRANLLGVNSFPQVVHVSALTNVNLGWVKPNAIGRSLNGADNLNVFSQTFFTNTVTPQPDNYLSRRPLFTLDGNITEDFSFHQVLDPGNYDDFGADTLWAYLNYMFTGPITTQEPVMLDRTTVLCVKDTGSASFREPLFGLESGMSTYDVEYIFYPKPWHSILLQDFFYNFDNTNMEALQNRMSSTIYDGMDYIIHDPTQLSLVHKRTSLKIRSRDSLDQKLKEITSVDQKYALLTPYTTVISQGSNSATVSIYSERGVPDYIFIFAERKKTYIDVGNPIISGVEFYGRTNKNKSLCNYLFDEHELWHATRRNSHAATSISDLRKVGGVLFSRTDLGTLERDEYEEQDCFDYDVRVQYIDETDSTQLLTEDVTVTVVTIYHNEISLKGPNGKMTFAEEKRY